VAVPLPDTPAAAFSQPAAIRWPGKQPARLQEHPKPFMDLIKLRPQHSSTGWLLNLLRELRDQLPAQQEGTAMQGNMIAKH
jgi:hypothetical protein